MYEAPPKYSELAPCEKRTEKDVLAEANRRTGDTATYLYYVRSVGWIPTLIFVVSITIFIFGQLFPSKWITWVLMLMNLVLIRVCSLVGQGMGFLQ